MNPIHLFALLVFLHALADYPLQGDFLARAKAPATAFPGVPWWQAMSAHCTIHAGMVGLATGSGVLALAEFGFHFLTDLAKTRGLISFNLDQAIHLACKAAYVVFLTSGPLP